MLAAVQNGGGEAAIKALCDLQRIKAERDAECSFNAALSQFQSLCPTVGKNASAEVQSKMGGVIRYDYTTLDQLTYVIAPHLKACGLSFSFDNPAGRVECTVYHTGGHSRRSGVPYQSGGTTAMSEHQKMASGLTYARRYALALALGIGFADEDDDTNSLRGEPQEEPVTIQELTRLSQRLTDQIQDTTDRGDWIRSQGINGPPGKVASWTRGSFESVMRAIDAMSGPREPGGEG
jgi:hypothetical protein